MNIPRLAAKLALAAMLVAMPAAAQQAQTVQGVVVNIGIVSAISAAHMDAQHGVHQGGHGSGAEHIIVSLADAKSGARIAGAQVSIEIRNPKGSLQKKPLMAMITSGFPDYSEVFDFGWSGKYAVRVSIRLKDRPPVRASFTVNHVI